MLCPICEIELVMSERKGIEIDYCPKCRGVWLDRGELDKIIERTKDYKAKDRYHEDREKYSNPDHKPKRDYQYKKRKSVLGEIFDIFD
ncbi:MAG: zf-TFIIB domain-containing protein [Phototrophicaceae bacterium]